MVDQRDDPSQGRKVRAKPPEPELVWVRDFLSVGGTDNITRYCRDDLNGVGLTRVVEGLMCGDLLWSEKCDGVGTLCLFRHCSEGDDVVEVLIWFSSGEAKLEIRGARVEENDREPNAA